MKIKVMGTGETTSEQALESMGDTALGVITAWNYDYNQDSKLRVAERRPAAAATATR